MYLHTLGPERRLAPFVPISYPPHVVALGSLYVAAILTSFEQLEQPEGDPEKTDNDIKLAGKTTGLLGQPGDWEQRFQVHLEDLEGTPQPI